MGHVAPLPKNNFLFVYFKYLQSVLQLIFRKFYCCNLYSSFIRLLKFLKHHTPISLHILVAAVE